MKIFSTDIKYKKEFDRIGYHYTMVRADDEHHVYLYEMEKGNPYSQYELVKGKKHTNPDGEVVYVYPSDEDFGVYGWYICGPKKKCLEEIERRWLNLTGGGEQITS